jgi:cephalosporin-C deacetylase
MLELLNMEGRNPKPADFDAYWERALAEMRSVDPQVELIKSDFQVPFAACYEMFWTGVRGARIHAKLLKPLGQGPFPAIMQFHGYSVHSGNWIDKLPYVAAGFVVAAMDCRGQGGLSEDTGGVKGTTRQGHIVRGLDDHPDQLLYRHIFLDTAQLAQVLMAMPEVDEQRIGAMGGSQGGALTIACGALEPRVRQLAPNSPFLCDYQRVWEMDVTNTAYQELQAFFRNHDPRHLRENEIFTKLGYIDLQHLADRIQGEVYMAVGLMDKACPPPSQFAMYNKIKAPKRLELYPDFGHEVFPGWHDLIMQFMLKLNVH